MAVRVTSNASEIALDLGQTGYRVTRRLSQAIDRSGIDLREKWQDNARETAGAHGSWYPSSIRSRMAGPLTSEIGPREGMKQGGMSFEFGSTNQPPHLDGQRALDSLNEFIVRRMRRAVLED